MSRGAAEFLGMVVLVVFVEVNILGLRDSGVFSFEFVFSFGFRDSGAMCRVGIVFS